jgi:hypothetical protein
MFHTKGNIVVFNILTFMFLGSRWKDKVFLNCMVRGIPRI